MYEIVGMCMHVCYCVFLQGFIEGDITQKE